MYLSGKLRRLPKPRPGTNIDELREALRKIANCAGCQGCRSVARTALGAPSNGFVGRWSPLADAHGNPTGPPPEPLGSAR